MTAILTSENRLFTLTRQGRRLPSAIVAIGVVPVMLALLIVTQVLARLLLRPLFAGKVQSVADPIAEIIGFLVIDLGLWVWLRYWVQAPILVARV